MFGAWRWPGCGITQPLARLFDPPCRGIEAGKKKDAAACASSSFLSLNRNPSLNNRSDRTCISKRMDGRRARGRANRYCFPANGSLSLSQTSRHESERKGRDEVEARYSLLTPLTLGLVHGFKCNAT